MRRPPLRILDLEGSYEEMGVRHGGTHAEEIRAYVEERVSLVESGLWSGGHKMTRSDVLDLAEATLPAHERHHQGLYGELCGLATGANITPEEAVIVGGFTDFVDTVRGHVGEPVSDQVDLDDCTAFLVPDVRAGGAGFFGQTWDMHDTATDHVILLRIHPTDAPAALLFTTTGCLGQLGMNEAGVSVGINNLTADDGTPGVTWPSVVRRVLECTTADEARDVIVGADLAGGHNYLVLDAEGVGYNIEAMPTVKVVTPLDDRPLVHTNHTTTREATAVQGPRTEELQQSSIDRFRTATEYLERDQIFAEDLMELTRVPDAICLTSRDPYRVETSGAALMRPRTRDFWTVWGPPTDNEYQQIPLRES